MAWTKTNTTYAGFRTYSETAAYGDGTVCSTSAITSYTGGGVLSGTQTSDGAGTADTGVALSVQISMDGTNWATVKTVTVIALVGSAARAFAVDMTGIHAPYIRLQTPLTTHTGTSCAWTIAIPTFAV